MSLYKMTAYRNQTVGVVDDLIKTSFNVCIYTSQTKFIRNHMIISEIKTKKKSSIESNKGTWWWLYINISSILNVQIIARHCNCTITDHLLNCLKNVEFSKTFVILQEAPCTLEKIII